MTMHAGQVDISVRQVRGLVDDQLPHLADASVQRLPVGGTVHAIFRLGPDLTARFPLLVDVPDLRAWIEREAEASAELAEVSTVPVPRPVHIGEPGHRYPAPWSVQTWISGTVATPTGTEASVDLAHDLACFVAALRDCDTRGRSFGGAGRGGTISDHDAWVEECLLKSEDVVDVPAVRRLWASLRTLPREDPDVMSHTDLTPGNVLLEGGRLVGVLDGGGFSAADPALDLVGAWHLLAAGPREVVRRELDSGDLEWERGRAWALEQAMGVVWYYRESNPSISHMGETTLRRLLEEV